MDVTISFTFTRGGNVKSKVVLQGIPVNPYADPRCWGADIIWFSMVLWLLVTEVLEIRTKIKEGDNVFVALVDYIGVWNFLDWVTIVIGLAVSVVWIVLMFQTADLNSKVTELLPWQSVEDFTATSHSVLRATLTVSSSQAFLRFVLLDHMLILIAGRFFKAFHAQPRLAIVT